MGLRCFFRGHDWTPWRRWSDDAPRIVRSYLEYLNDDTAIRDCRRCEKRQAERPMWRFGIGYTMSNGADAPTPI